MVRIEDQIDVLMQRNWSRNTRNLSWRRISVWRRWASARWEHRTLWKMGSWLTASIQSCVMWIYLDLCLAFRLLLWVRYHGWFHSDHDIQLHAIDIGATLWRPARTCVIEHINMFTTRQLQANNIRERETGDNHAGRSLSVINVIVLKTHSLTLIERPGQEHGHNLNHLDMEPRSPSSLYTSTKNLCALFIPLTGDDGITSLL